MLDIDRLSGDELEPGVLEFQGDTVLVRAPYERIPWVEAVLGCPIRATIKGGSMRTRAFVRNWDEWEHRDTHWNNDWFDLLMQLTELLVARSGGRHAITPTLMRGPVDLAEAVLGPKLMCLSMYDDPHALHTFLENAADTFIRVLKGQSTRLPSIEGGQVNLHGL